MHKLPAKPVISIVYSKAPQVIVTAAITTSLPAANRPHTSPRMIVAITATIPPTLGHLREWITQPFLPAACNAITVSVPQANPPIICRPTIVARFVITLEAPGYQRISRTKVSQAIANTAITMLTQVGSHQHTSIAAAFVKTATAPMDGNLPTSSITVRSSVAAVLVTITSARKESLLDTYLPTRNAIVAILRAVLAGKYKAVLHRYMLI